MIALQPRLISVSTWLICLTSSSCPSRTSISTPSSFAFSSSPRFWARKNGWLNVGRTAPMRPLDFALRAGLAGAEPDASAPDAAARDR